MHKVSPWEAVLVLDGSHADMHNFLGPDIASEIPLETDRCEGSKYLKASRLSVGPLSPTLLLVIICNVNCTI